MLETASERYTREVIEPGEDDSLARIARLIPSGARVLDLGASRGALGRSISQRGCIVDGVEGDAPSAEQARRYYRRVLTADLDEVDLRSALGDCEYDVVVCADVLEHLRVPERTLRSVRAVLAAKGELLVSVPNVAYAGVVVELILGRFDYRSHGLLDETHLRFFTRESIVKLLNLSGFGVSQVEPIHLELKHSEFDPDRLAQLPGPVLGALISRPDGLAYQFLLRASPGDGNAPGILSTGLESELRVSTQLYWRGPDGPFSEDRSQTVAFPLADGPHRVTFAVPGPTTLAALRWDPLDRPGLVRLHRMELVGADGTSLWSSEGRRLSEEGSRSGDVRWLGSTRQPTLLAIGRDPWIEVPFDAPIQLLADAALCIEFSLAPLEEGLRVTEALLQAEQKTASAVAQSERSLRLISESTASLEQAIQTDGSERRQLRSSWQAVESELRGTINALSQLSGQLEASRKMQAAQLSKLDALEDAVSTFSEARLRRLLGRARGELYRVRRELGRREYRFQIVPGPQVDASQTETWNSFGDDPQLELVPLGGKYPYGLVLVRYRLESDVDEAALYFDLGSGYDESHQISLPRGAQELVVPLPANVRRLRLDPRESPGPFQLAGLTITEISAPALMRQRAWSLLDSISREPSKTPVILRSAVRALLHGGLPTVARIRMKDAPGGEGPAYAKWVRRFGTFTPEDRERALRAMKSWKVKPKVSVVMPVFNAPESLLTRAIESVRAQVYENWELCIADDASTDRGVGRVLEAFAEKDSRIRTTRRERNGHISAATNSALEQVSGEYTVFLDHDDELTPDALALVVDALNRWPDTDLLYSDEDKLDAEGERIDPAFKPDWSPELLLAQNYVCHLLAIRTELIRTVGGMRIGLEGSQDHDLVLRVSELISPERIRHLPFILYHWRAIGGSTATGDAKPYASGAGVRAVKEALQRRGLRAEVTSGRAAYSYRVRYALPDPPPRVSIVIPTRDGLDLLRTCISTVRQRTLYADYEILVVDNDSAEPETLEYLADLETLGQARVLRYPKRFNFSAINNFAVEHATGSVVVLLNNDIEVISPDWLREMVSVAVQPEVGAVGALLLYPDGRIQHAGVVVGMGGVAGHAYKREPGGSWGHSRQLTVRREVSAVTAACLAVERAKYERVGGLDAEHLRVAFNDVDFCLKLRDAGLRNIWTPHAVLRHHESVSRGSDERPERRAEFQAEVEYMKEKWKRILGHDPFFNPNWSFGYEIPQFAFPPRVTAFYRAELP